MSRPLSRRQFLGRSSVGLLSAAACVRTLGQTRGTALNLDTPLQDVIATLQATIPRLLDKHAVPGLSIALIRDAGIAWAAGFGVRNVGTRAPVTVDTVFEAASLSKPTFGFYALKLCEQAVLDLDTPLTESRDELLIADEPHLEQITARLCLSHTSGLPHGRRGPKLKLRTDPNKEFHYSATGLDYLQSVVEQTTKQGIAEFLRTNVLDPFGMKSSSFLWRERDAKVAAQGYDREGKPGQTWNETFFAVWDDAQRAAHLSQFPEARMPSAAAGMYTTASDFARFLIANMEPGKTSFHLGTEMTQEMLTPQVLVLPGLHWGLGWGLQITPPTKSFWHWGDWGIYQHFALAYPAERLGLVVLTNSGNGLKLANELVPMAVGGEHPAFRYLQ